MPHDANGVKLQKGDKVILRGTVGAITSEHAEYCNITFLCDKKMADDAGKYEVALSARMVEKEAT